MANHLNKKLFLLEHQIKSEPVKRYIWMSADVKRAVDMPWPVGAKGDRLPKMRATMEHFTAGGDISWADDPDDKPPTTFLARVNPKNSDVRDIRVLEPGRIRIFGRFGMKDHFVALNWEYREHLKGKNFDHAVVRCVEIWRELFPHDPLFSGVTADDCISQPYSIV